MQGYLSFVLHAHLPFVRHPEHEDFLEERWFFEGMTETYLPLLQMMHSLDDEKIDFRLTMSLTPPLVSMMTDGLLVERYARHLRQLIDLAEKEIQRTAHDERFNRLAHMYRTKFHACRAIFEGRYGRNIVTGFRHFQDLGKLEIITSGATHGFLPLLRPSHEAVRAQISVAVEHYEQSFGRRPRGIWLPECGYYPGLDELLADCGIRFFFVDSHGILNADARPKYGVYAPLFCPSGVAAFGRDFESSKQVWSAREGYPGDVWYRDFYRDIGFDLEFEYIRPHIHRDGLRVMTGMKYHRITGPLNHKEPYDPHVAWEKTVEHADNFVFNRIQQVKHLASVMGRPPIVVAPYDAELFGHWWYEGIDWLSNVIRRIASSGQDYVKLITPWEYVMNHPKNQMALPSESTWGNRGYSEVWCNATNDWIYRHLHEAASRMTELARAYPSPDDNLRRALNQMARELLLAQSSDWAFIMNSGTMVEYAVKRTKEHVWRLNRLYNDIKGYRLNMDFVATLEGKDNIFPYVDYRSWC